MNHRLIRLLAAAVVLHAGTASAQFGALFGAEPVDEGKLTAQALERHAEFAETAAFANFLLVAAAPLCAQPYPGFMSGATVSRGFVTSYTPKDPKRSNAERLYLLEKFGPHPEGVLVAATPHRWLGLDAAGFKPGDVIRPPSREDWQELFQSVPIKPAAPFQAPQMALLHAFTEMPIKFERAGVATTVSLPAGSKCADFAVVEGQGHWADAASVQGIRATVPLLKKLSKVERASVFAREIGYMLSAPAPFLTIIQPPGMLAALWNKEAQMLAFSQNWRTIAADLYAIQLLSQVGVSASEYARTMVRLDSSEFGSALFDSNRYSITRPLFRSRLKLLEEIERAQTSGQPLPSVEEAVSSATTASHQPVQGSVKWVREIQIDEAFARPPIAKWLPEVREWLRKP